MTQASQTTRHPHHQELVDEAGRWKYTNALAEETSPYLLQHAHNPVDWLPWGQPAFEKARAQNKPIFLSVGYSTCYWCHVMERQVFENPRIAEQMNARVVSIKVDREERPDIDELYMTATQLMTGHGGWPMSVFLTPPGPADDDDPGLKPFWAGTYIPPEPMRGMPSFPQLLDGIADAWQQRRQEVLDQAEKVTQAISQHLATREEPAPVNAALVQQITQQLLRQYDPAHGGFGGAPKFPQHNSLGLLIRVHENNGISSVWEAIEQTLAAMARGGMYDQIGGGFHRYATDEQWLVPHFEKMLYDNGQLLTIYARALESTDDPAMQRLCRSVLTETAEYALREMIDETGAFYSAQDAEVDGREGGSYIWTVEQVREAIDDDELAELAITLYGLDRGTNFRDPHDPDATPANVLYLPEPIETASQRIGRSVEDLEQARRQINAKLLAARDRRPQPRTDDKVLAGWNGLMIAGLAEAGRALNEPRYINTAAGAAEAIHHHMREGEDGLYRSMRAGQVAIPGQLEDYALLAGGLLALHRAGGDDRWHDWAVRLVEAAEHRFAAEQGGYHDTLADQRDLLVRIRSAMDGSVPSGNSQMVHNLLDLHGITGQSGYFDRAEHALRSFSHPMSRQGPAMTHMAHALLRALEAEPARFQAEGETEPTVRIWSDRTTIDLSDGEASVAVHLEMAPGYHVSAHEPGEAGMTPTTLTLRGAEGLVLKPDYPAGQNRQFPFADGRIQVYEGHVLIPATLEKVGPIESGAQPELVVHYQPCSDQACHQAASEAIPLTIESSGA